MLYGNGSLAEIHLTGIHFRSEMSLCSRTSHVFDWDNLYEYDERRKSNSYEH
jgi:hypothetical protein